MLSVIKASVLMMEFIITKFPFYWYSRKTFRKYVFKFRSRLFQIVWWFGSEKRKIKNLSAIMSLTSKDILYGLLGVLAVYWIPYAVWGVDFLGNENVSDYYETVLSTVAGVSGVVIGLFYAAILSIGTTVYSKLPAEAKDGLNNEPVGSLYIRILSYLTFFCIVLLFLRFNGYEESVLALNIVLVWAGIASFALVKLGSRLFYFTDPTLLAKTSLSILKDLIDLSKVSKINSRDPSIQKHYLRLADTNIRTLHLLKSIASQEDHLSTESFLQLSQDCMGTLNYYLSVKSQIPVNSYWFDVYYKHKKWFKVSNILLETTEMVGSIQPEEVKDTLWLEKKLSAVAIDCLKKNISTKNYQIASACLNDLAKILFRLVRMHELELCIELFSSFEDAVLDVDYKNLSDDDLLSLMSIIDTLGYVRSNLILKHLEAIKIISGDYIETEIGKIRWRNEASIYKTKLPGFAHERLVQIYGLVDTEYLLEGRRVTPDWFIKNHAMQVTLERVIKNTERLVDFISLRISSLKAKPHYTQMSQDRNGVLILSALVDRSLEQASKMKILCDDFFDLYEAVKGSNKIPGLPWPVLDTDLAKKKVTDLETSLLEEIASLSTLMNKWNFPDKFPDYTGKFLHFTGNLLIEGLIRGDISAATFRYFFVSSLLMFEKIRTEHIGKPDWIIKENLQVAVAPVLDLMSLSGFAFLLSHYHNKPAIWDIVKNQWDIYLNLDPADKDGKLKKMHAIFSYPQTVFGIPHRDFHRSKWQTRVRYFLEENIETETTWMQPGGARAFQERLIVKHDSPIVRAFLEGNVMMDRFEGEDVFIDVYLLGQTSHLNLSFSPKQDSFNKKVQHETTSGTEGNEDQSGGTDEDEN